MNAGLLAVLGTAQALLGGVPPVPDDVLAGERGGFQLPNGIDIALTVQTQTAINGAVVLRTVFQANQGTPSMAVYVPRAGETVPDTAAKAAAASSGTGPQVTYDSRYGLQVTPGIGGSTVTLGGSTPGASPPAGLEQVAGGATDAGLVSQATQNGLRTVELTGSDLSVVHFAGNAFGSAIANSGSDRTISTETSVGIDLSNAGPDVLGSAMLRVADVAATASAMRAQ